MFLWYCNLLRFIASIAIITTLCSVRFRRKSEEPTTLSDSSEMEMDLSASNSPSSTRKATTPISLEQQQQQQPRTSAATEMDNNGNMLMKELPLPPAMQVHNDSNIPINVKRTTSERRVSFNMSLKLPRSFSMVKNKDQHHNKEDDEIGKKAKLKPDESVWMKTIILGEKCNPDEEEDAIIYERKGKKISAYHPKKSTSMSLSRQWSSIDPEALSVPHAQSNEERINNM
ncbi:unnamed protein product [Lupinus luteus]|uniref:Uncharacterized protein n=1 Tax=Lupinus luteus TaxID=3873 RepID=A0AAV1YG47_LUPLU